MSYHSSGRSMADELRRIADQIENLGDLGETSLHVNFQVASGDASAAIDVNRIHRAFFDSMPEYSRNGIYGTPYKDQISRDHTWINAYAKCKPPRWVADAAYDEAKAEDATRADVSPNADDVEAYFAFDGRWRILNDDERRRLVHLCGISGWSGDWAAAYATVAVSELQPSRPPEPEPAPATTGCDCIGGLGLGPELGMYDHVYAGWPTNKDRRAGATRF